MVINQITKIQLKPFFTIINIKHFKIDTHSMRPQYNLDAKEKSGRIHSVRRKMQRLAGYSLIPAALFQQKMNRL